MSVQSLTRAFDILSIVSSYPNGIGVTAIAQESGLHKSTVSRLLGTLEEIGAVIRLANYDGYCIGQTVLDLAAQTNPEQKLLNLAHPFLVELSDVTTESTTLEVPDGRFIHYLDQVQSNHQIRVNDWIGRRHAMHTVTSGILFMRDWPAADLERYFTDDIEAPTPNTITKLKTMKKKLSAAADDGYAMEPDTFEIGLTGISAPIYGANEKIIGAINICGPNFRFPAVDRLPLYIERLVNATRTISDRLKQYQTKEQSI